MEPSFPLFDLHAESGWRQISSIHIDAGPHVMVEQASFRTPSRAHDVKWTIAHRKAAVAVIPMLEDGRLLLISQERIPVRHTMWEFPAGQIDLPYDEVTCGSVVETALSELREEAGCELSPGGQLEPLGWYFPSAGFTQEVVYLFLARPVRIAHEPRPVGSEYISGTKQVTLEELLGMIAANEVTASITLAAAAKLCALGAQKSQG